MPTTLSYIHRQGEFRKSRSSLYINPTTPKEQLQGASGVLYLKLPFIYKNVEEEWEIQWFSPKREVLHYVGMV